MVVAAGPKRTPWLRWPSASVLRGNIDAEVDDLVAVAAKHHGHEVLADVMEVALDRADDDDAPRLDAGLGQVGLELGQPGVHGPGGHEDLGDEDLVVLELDAEALHPGDEPLVQDLRGRHPGGERLVDERFDLGLLP
jgi:hypothetical protein